MHGNAVGDERREHLLRHLFVIESDHVAVSGKGSDCLHVVGSGDGRGANGECGRRLSGLDEHAEGDAELDRRTDAHPGELTTADDADDRETTRSRKGTIHAVTVTTVSRCVYASVVLQRLRLSLDVLWRELAKFGVIGFISFVIDLGGFNLLVSGPMQNKVTSAKLVSGAVATLFAWIGNRYWTFRNRRNRPVHHEVLLFFAVNGVALVISAAWVALAHYVFHARGTVALNLAAFTGIGLGTVLRFWAYRTVVFVNEPDVGAVDEVGSQRADQPDVAADRKSANTAG